MQNYQQQHKIGCWWVSGFRSKDQSGSTQEDPIQRLSSPWIPPVQVWISFFLHILDTHLLASDFLALALPLLFFCVAYEIWHGVMRWHMACTPLCNEDLSPRSTCTHAHTDISSKILDWFLCVHVCLGPDMQQVCSIWQSVRVLDSITLPPPPPSSLCLLIQLPYYCVSSLLLALAGSWIENHIQSAT